MKGQISLFNVFKYVKNFEALQQLKIGVGAGEAASGGEMEEIADAEDDFGAPEAVAGEQTMEDGVEEIASAYNNILVEEMFLDDASVEGVAGESMFDASGQGLFNF